jgi:hypothetical protein
MDRLKLTLTGCGLAVLLAASGCRNLRSEVPPGRPFSSDANQAPTVGFSSDPHPGLNPGAGAMPGAPGTVPGMTSESAGKYGTPAPGASDNYGAPTANSYGPPGTSPLGMPPSAGPDSPAPTGGSPSGPTTPGLPGTGAGAGLPGSASGP